MWNILRLPLRSRDLCTEQRLPQRLLEPTSVPRSRAEPSILAVGSLSSDATDMARDFVDATTNFLSCARELKVVL